MNTKRGAIVLVAAVAALLAGCSSSQDVPTTSTNASTTAPTTSVATIPSTIASSTPDQAAAAEASEAARVAAEQEAERVAAESSAAAQSAADQSAADQAEADRIAAESTTQAPAAEWYDSRGWVSPGTAQRALDAGIPWGGDVPGYLRCGTICGEEPTSGEVQMANGCADGYIPASECAAQGIPGGGPERTPEPTIEPAPGQTLVVGPDGQNYYYDEGGLIAG